MGLIMGPQFQVSIQIKQEESYPLIDITGLTATPILA